MFVPYYVIDKHVINYKIHFSRLENVERAVGARQPMFHTGMGRSVLVSKSSIDKARAVLEDQEVANEG